MNPKFNPSLTSSDILKIVGFIIAAVVGFYAFKETVVEKLGRIEERVIAVSDRVGKLEIQISDVQMYLYKRAEEKRLNKFSPIN